jgi:chloride channel 7
LDYTLNQTEIYKTRPETFKIEAYSWLIYLLTGALTGVTAFLIGTVEEFLVEIRWHSSQKVINSGYFFSAYLLYMILGIAFAVTALVLTIYVAPGAQGSGIPEIMAYLNGINYPGFISKRTLFIKSIGVAFAVSAGYKVGKEGPLAHIGANMGVLVTYLPFGFTKFFRNDKNKREIIAAGAGAGVSAAFGSPIGGTLFAYEISRPSNFYTFGLMWKGFLCSSIATFILNLLDSAAAGEGLNLANAGRAKFGKFAGSPFELSHLPLFVLIGCLCGMLGSFFIIANNYINSKRRKYLTTKFSKLVEGICLIIVIGTIVFFIPNATGCLK